MLQRCRLDGKFLFYPRVLCPHCGSKDLEWAEASGEGTVYSTTVVRREPEAGGDYNVVLVDLSDGPRMMSRIEEIAPEAVRIGMPVRARIVRDGERPLVIFTPSESIQ
jgi:uncharacterized protein